jgi:hypothetical protein
VIQEAESQELVGLHAKTQTKTGRKHLKQLLRAALPKEYRLPA